MITRVFTSQCVPGRKNFLVYIIMFTLLVKGNDDKYRKKKCWKFNPFCFFHCRLTPSVPFTTRTIDTEMVLGDYQLPKGVSQINLLY